MELHSGLICGGWGPSPPPPPPKEKEKKTKEIKKTKKERKKGTMKNVKLLHIKCFFFQFSNSPVALKNNKNLAP